MDTEIREQVTYHIHTETFYSKVHAERYQEVLVMFNTFCGYDKITINDVMNNPKLLLKLLQEYVDSRCKPYEFTESKFVPSESFSNHKELDVQLCAMCGNGEKISAIKLLRQHYPDCQIKDAVAAIEAWYYGVARIVLD